mgnify:CR=1 FL=1
MVMGWFSKKEKVPDIPPAPKLPPLPNSQEKPEKITHELPSIPSNVNENLNQQIVKSAVHDNPLEDKEVDVEVLPKDFDFKKSQKLPQLPRFPPQQEQRKTLELSPSISESKTKQIEPVFVRMDKFLESKKDFESIKKRVKGIEATLAKIKEVKQKEDAEISSWIEDLEKLKSRLAEIDSNIFNRL